jgi:hypothetical protein
VAKLRYQLLEAGADKQASALRVRADAHAPSTTRTSWRGVVDPDRSVGTVDSEPAGQEAGSRRIPQLIGKDRSDALVSEALAHLLWHRTFVQQLSCATPFVA